MCGIAGIWGQSDEKLVRRMIEQMSHRGPDAKGLHSNSTGTLGHCCLSIMEPVCGKQPIYNENRKGVIVANGDIYNSPSLREQLSNKHIFQTPCDSESILHLYEDFGSIIVRHLQGVFAFAIAEDKDIFLARDPIGIKPLYYGRRDKAFVFASELKALIGIAEKVQEFPPGTCYNSNIGFKSYYLIPDRILRDMPLDVWLKIIRETLEHAVIKRLMSDVPVGAFLSGGLGSSIIAAIAKRHLAKLHTFSVGIEGSRDIKAARVVAQHIGSIHHEYLFTANEIKIKLPEIIYYLESFDLDLVRSAIPCYFASRLASEYVKVILTGDGADEVFAGYSYYKNIPSLMELQKELRRSISSLHNTTLQRIDRITMAHSIEGRIPFLDMDLIEMAQTIPPKLKLYLNGDRHFIGKWILRKACEDLLPSEIIWREKEQFDEGSGTIDILPKILKGCLRPVKVKQYSQRYPKAKLLNMEEVVYHKMLIEAYSDTEEILGLAQKRH